MTILVTGANGQLGNEMRLVALKSQDRYIFSDVRQNDGVETVCLDMTDFEAVRSFVAGNEVDVIVNCAAYTDVNAAESNEELAESLNVTGPGNLALAMREAGGLLVHVSTDYVFGGDSCNVPYDEMQECAPSGVYGRTKFLGEQRVRSTGCAHVILRTSWLYSEFGNNFCRKMLDLMSVKPEIKVVFDQVGTPTYALDLAEAIAAVLADYKAECHAKRCIDGCYSKSGIYHYSDEGVCSWYDFAEMIAEYAGLKSCEITPCHSDEFPSPVRRPAYSVLDKTRIKNTFGIKIPYWTDSLKKCMENIRRGKFKQQGV